MGRSSRTKPSRKGPNGPGLAGRTTNLLSPASTYCPSIRRASSQPRATSVAGSASGRRRRIEASSASGMPSSVTGRLSPKWSSSTSRSASAAASWMSFTAAPASAGVSSEPSHPSASRPTRRSAAGAEPPSQMSSGLAGRGLTVAPDTEKKRPAKSTCLGREQQPQQLQRLVEDGGPVARGDGKQRPFGILGRPQPEHRQHPAGGQPGQRRELLGHQHRMPARQHRDPAARLQPPGPGQRERHAGERLHHRGVHGLRQPQRVHPGLLERVDRVGELVGGPGRSQGYANPDLHAPMGSQGPCGAAARVGH